DELDGLVAVVESVSDATVLRTVAQAARRCGTDEAKAVASPLQERLAGADASVDEACALALALGVLGPEHQVTAADALSRLVTEGGLCPTDMVSVAAALVELTTNGRQAAAHALQRLLRRTDVELGVQV